MSQQSRQVGTLISKRETITKLYKIVNLKSPTVISVQCTYTQKNNLKKLGQIKHFILRQFQIQRLANIYNPFKVYLFSSQLNVRIICLFLVFLAFWYLFHYRFCLNPVFTCKFFFFISDQVKIHEYFTGAESWVEVEVPVPVSGPWQSGREAIPADRFTTYIFRQQASRVVDRNN